MQRTNERGLTLVEVLAVFVITVIIGLIAYSVLFSGFRTYERVNIEASLRDEADLIMSELIGEIFYLKESEIANKRFPEPGTKNYYFELNDGKRTGFIDGKLVIEDEEKSNVLNSGFIRLDQNNTKIEEVDPDTGQYRIVLTLVHGENEQTLTTESEIVTIYDIK